MSHAATEPGFMAHIRSWFEKDVEPDLADLKADAKRFRQMAPALERIASVVEALAKLDPGISPEVVADVEEAAVIVARIAAELAVVGI